MVAVLLEHAPNGTGLRCARCLREAPPPQGAEPQLADPWGWLQVYTEGRPPGRIYYARRRRRPDLTDADMALCCGAPTK